MKNKEKIYLGLSFGFNSSACVVSNTRGLLSAISQERLNGEKNTKQIPFEAALKCLEIARVHHIDCIAVCHYEEMSVGWLNRYGSNKYLGLDWKNVIRQYFIEKGFEVEDRVVRVNHHKAHQYAAFGFYGKPKTSDFYMITSDGFGDGLSGTIANGEGRIISQVLVENSVGLVYQFVTGALGFKEHQHEGKITGLAGFGNPRYVDRFYEMYMNQDIENGLKFTPTVKLTENEYWEAQVSSIIDFDKFLLVKKQVYNIVNELKEEGATREDIAASVQVFSEDVTLKWIRENCEPGKDAYLAGGLFANVSINHKVKDLGIFDNVYVCPAMGDEGTCVGAAIYTAWKTDGEYSDNVGHVSMSTKVISGSDVKGNADSYDDIINELNHRGLQDSYRVTFMNDNEELIEKIANDLANDRIVCVMRDKMEFGPRALLHRSILYNCKSKDTNKWLNNKLNRTEFMPFAPWCRAENADALFKNLDGGRYSAKFMTMTFDGTDEFVANYPAACHVDNTARPQVVSFGDDYFMWKVMERYEKLTGLKALINTSFNLHNHPIIESEMVGLDSWLQSDTDTLVIGSVVIEKIGGRDSN